MKIFHLDLPSKIIYKKNKISKIDHSSVAEIFSITAIQSCFDISIDEHWHSNKYGFPLSRTEITTFLTHREAWKRITEEKPAFHLIIEENISIDFDLNDAIRDLENLPDDWDVFFPYDMYQVAEEESQLKNVELLNENVREKRELEAYLLSFNWGSSIYFINLNGAQKLLETSVIKQTVEDEMISLTAGDRLNMYYSEVSWFNIRNHPKKNNIEREEIILDTILSYNVWTEDDNKLLHEVLKIISTTASELNIPLILQGGSHLGYVRHGGKMPWDDDIDIGIEKKYVEKLIEKLIEKDLSIKLLVERRTDSVYYKIWSDKGIEIKGYPYKFPFVDLWMYQIIGEDFVFENGIICPNAASSTLKDVQFENSIFQIVHNSLACLDTRYKDWRNTIRIYSWSHKNERPENYILKAHIKVNEYGRLIKNI